MLVPRRGPGLLRRRRRRRTVRVLERRVVSAHVPRLCSSEEGAVAWAATLIGGGLVFRPLPPHSTQFFALIPSSRRVHWFWMYTLHSH